MSKKDKKDKKKLKQKQIQSQTQNIIIDVGKVLKKIKRRKRVKKQKVIEIYPELKELPRPLIIQNMPYGIPQKPTEKPSEKPSEKEMIVPVPLATKSEILGMLEEPISLPASKLKMPFLMKENVNRKNFVELNKPFPLKINEPIITTRKPFLDISIPPYETKINIPINEIIPKEPKQRTSLTNINEPFRGKFGLPAQYAKPNIELPLTQPSPPIENINVISDIELTPEIINIEPKPKPKRVRRTKKQIQEDLRNEENLRNEILAREEVTKSSQLLMSPLLEEPIGQTQITSFYPIIKKNIKSGYIEQTEPEESSVDTSKTMKVI
jgi:hypothetical protein